jgi:transposase-like protein
LIDAARPSRHVAGNRWFVDETYLKVAGRWVYLYRTIDQYGQVIAVLAAPKRDLAATRRFFARALTVARRPTEVTTDRAPAYPRVLDEVAPEAWHIVEQYANNPIEADHGRLKARTRLMRGLNESAAPRRSVAGTRSARTCAEATTNSGTTPSPATGSKRSSPNSPSPSEPGGHCGPSLSHPRQRKSAPLTASRGHKR